MTPTTKYEVRAQYFTVFVQFTLTHTIIGSVAHHQELHKIAVLCPLHALQLCAECCLYDICSGENTTRYTIYKTHVYSSH
jgi:hypothetical protein